jgi:hypothetical protein
MVLSHIIQKRFSQVNEDVATDALAYIINSSDEARDGLLKLLRSLVTNIPDLQFKTQQTEGSIRPDMWGFEDGEPRVFFENKFWAGLTDNQPVAYLRQLAEYSQPTILLVVAPETRGETLWRELLRRLDNEDIPIQQFGSPPGIIRSGHTSLGPILALTSWKRILSIIETGVVDDPNVKSDLNQLKTLCDAADRDAFVPFSSVDISDQRTPNFFLQLGVLVQACVNFAITENILNTTGLRPQANWERFGQYARFSNEEGVGVWFGVHLLNWKNYGETPLWLQFPKGSFGRAREVKKLLEKWAAGEGIFTTTIDDEFFVAVEITTGEEKDQVVRDIVKRLKVIGQILAELPPKK